MSNKLCCARTLLTSPTRPSTRLAHRILPERAFLTCCAGRALRRLFFGRLFAARLRPLIEVGHAAIENWRDLRIGLRSLLGLVRDHRILDEAANQTFERVISAFELRRMMNRAGRAWLAAKPAVHALCDVDIELREQHLPRLGVLVPYDHDAIDRTCALARQASGADLEIDFQDSSITER